MQHSLVLSTTYLRVFHKIVIDDRTGGAVSGAGWLLAVAGLQSPVLNPRVLAKTRAAAL
jgi:hypothetical protein